MRHAKPEISQPELQQPDWHTWISKYDKLVWLRLLSRGVDEERANDLKQEVWITLMRRHRAGELTALQMPGLALRQAEFLALSLHRSAQRAPNLVPLEAASVGARDHGVESQLVDRAHLLRILDCVRQSPPTTRRVFELLYAPPQLSVIEVSAKVGISVQRVRQITCELRKQLGRLR